MKVIGGLISIVVGGISLLGSFTGWWYLLGNRAYSMLFGVVLVGIGQALMKEDN